MPKPFDRLSRYFRVATLPLLLICERDPNRLWYGEPNAIGNAIDYAKFRSPSHNAVIRVYDAAGNVIETQKHKGEFREW